MKTHEVNFVLVDDTPEPDLDSFAQDLQEITTAATTVRTRLAKYADNIDNDSLRRQAEALRTWMDINSEGLAVAARVAELGSNWAGEIRIRLETAARDLERLDGGSENVPSRANLAASEMIQVWNEVNSILDSMEALYRAPTVVPPLEAMAEPAAAFMHSPPYPK
jgi:hypothetical protein